MSGSRTVIENGSLQNGSRRATDVASQPINHVRWVRHELLQANSWNPNNVATPEMALLKISILEDGWATAIVVQEVLTTTDPHAGPPTLDHYEIVDGFHRWTVAADEEVAAMTDGLVPVVVVATDPAHARISTIRFNRARGKHAVTRMSDIVGDLVDTYQLPPDEIEARLGMDTEEVKRLRDRGSVLARLSKEKMGEAWRPAPTGTRRAEDKPVTSTGSGRKRQAWQDRNTAQLAQDGSPQ
jgi:ParB-like chromosome segregation protein Spo0J